MALLERDGERIFYSVTGSGPPLVLGHSLLCGAWMWDPMAAELSQRHTLINIEFRGHGQSSARKPFSLHDLVADWLAILDRLSIDKAALVGLSMGAMTAMRFALAHPSRVQALALLDTSADPESTRKRIEYGALSVLYRKLGMNDLLASRVMPIMLGKTTRKMRPDRSAALTERIRQHDRTALVRCIDAVVKRDDISEQISSITCPTLVVIGDEDVATPPPCSTRIRERIKASRLVTIPGAGHLSAWERPDLVQPELLQFFTEAT